MPPPAAVCILAIVSTVGAAVAFKHFVYDPHLSHVVRRWKEEFVQWRSRPHRDDDEPEVPMHERDGSSGLRQSVDTAVSSDEETLGNGSSDGLLSRSRLRNLLQEENLHSSSIELDNLVARELYEWRNEVATSSGQDLRQRNVSNNASRQGAYRDGSGPSHPLELEEDTKPLPFVPLSPRRTHVLYNSGSASPALSNIPDGLPSPPQTTISGGATLPSLPSPSNTTTASPLLGSPLSGSISASQDPLLRRPLMQTQPGEIQVPPNLGRKLTSGSPPPAIDFSHDFQLPPNIIPLSTRVSLLNSGHSPARNQEQELAFSIPIPSLSQSYPQELEIEHGLELLSPPSSRSDSPFSMANISPHPTHQSSDGDGFIHHRTVSPFLIDVDPPEVFSPALSIGMGLGNESFATLSPAVGPRQLALRAAGSSDAASPPGSGFYPTSTIASGLADAPPFLSGAAVGDPSSTPLSVTSSLKSSEYLSFPESESGKEEDDDDVPLAARRASLISAVTSHPNSSSTNERLGHTQGLGLKLVPHPGNSPAPLSPSMLSPRSRLAEVSTSGYGVHLSIGPLSDTSELSDLDLLSDYNAQSELGEMVSHPGSVNGSESGRANAEGVRLHSPLQTATNPSSGTPSGRITNESSDRDSDTSWSMAGGSEFGDDEDYPGREPQTPQLRPVRKAGESLRRDDTIRGRQRL